MLQIISSSHILESVVHKMEREDTVSNMKSRELTPSMEFSTIQLLYQSQFHKISGQEDAIHKYFSGSSGVFGGVSYNFAMAFILRAGFFSG